MKKSLLIFISLAILISCLIYYLLHPSSYQISKKIKTIELIESNFNIEVYYLEGNFIGAYGVGDLAFYKVYNCGLYCRIYRIENRGISYNYKKVNNEMIKIFIKKELFEYYENIDTLESGKIFISGGTRSNGFEYDTVFVSL
jgi:hypothetical protein